VNDIFEPIVKGKGGDQDQSHKNAGNSAHIKLALDILQREAREFVGFTVYRRAGFERFRRKYLRMNSTGSNGHKFRQVTKDPVKHEWTFQNGSAEAPLDWRKALFHCFYREGFFDYFGSEYKSEMKQAIERTKTEEQFKAKWEQYCGVWVDPTAVPIPKAPPNPPVFKQPTVTIKVKTTKH